MGDPGAALSAGHRIRVLVRQLHLLARSVAQAGMIEPLYIVLAVFAVLCGTVDALLIRNDQPISHGIRAVVRILFAVGYLVALVWGIQAVQPRFILQLIGGAAAFNIVFRFWLNMLRQRPPDYISTSNWYDRQFLALARIVKLKSEGGNLAYAVEASVALIVATVYTIV